MPLTRDTLAATASWAPAEGDGGDCCTLLAAVAAKEEPVRPKILIEDAWLFAIRSKAE